MRRVNPISIRVKAPSRGLITRFPGETADQFVSGNDRFNSAGIANRASISGSNVRYENGVVCNAPGYDRVSLTASILEGLLAHWRLDEPSGTRFEASLNHYDLTESLGVDQTVGVGQIGGKFQSAALFSIAELPATITFIAIPDDQVSGGIDQCQTVISNAGVAYIDDGTNFYSSSDGLNWTLLSNHGSLSVCAIFADSQFVIGGNSGFLKTSPDGVTWTTRTSNVTGAIFAFAFSGTRFVGIDDNGDVTYSTNSGVTWTQVVAGLTSIGSLAFGNGVFVAVGDDGGVQTSPDGITWTAQTSGTAETLFDVIFDGTKFVAVGVANTIITSLNGVTWTPVTPTGLASGAIGLIAWSGTRYGIFIALGWHFYTSTNLTTWTETTATFVAPAAAVALTAMNSTTFILAEQDIGF